MTLSPSNIEAQDSLPAWSTKIDATHLESVLLGEFSHRVANDFSAASAAIRIVRRGIENSGEAELLNALAEKVDALGRIQRLLLAPRFGERIDLSARLEDLCELMSRARFTEQSMVLAIDKEGTDIDAERGWRVLMIFAELLVNTARHAVRCGPITVYVSANTRGNRLFGAVQDDGSRREPRRAKGYGSAVIDALLSDLGGEILVESTSVGMVARFSLPVDAGQSLLATNALAAKYD